MIEIFYTLIVTHITIICVTLYLHRHQAHKSFTLNPFISHLMRLWLWLTTGMITKQWVAVHRKHHRFCETIDDPHSPKTQGLLKVIFGGAFLYHAASKDSKMVDNYGVGTPNDWIERKLYTPYSNVGVGILLLFNVWLFGWIGFIIWTVQMIWIPFWAAGFINGVGHYFGYRNGSTDDNSKNILPWGIFVGGEELHNNHHLNPKSCKLSRKWWEFDLGWFYLRILILCRLAKIR